LNAEGRDLRGERLDPTLDPELRGSVRRAKLLTDDTCRRRDHDDEPGALTAHDGQDCSGDVERPEHRRFDLRAKVFRRDLLEEAGIEVPRVVDEDADAVEPVGGSSHGAVLSMLVTSSATTGKSAWVPRAERTCSGLRPVATTA
jgi:hypothetical protein